MAVALKKEKHRKKGKREWRAAGKNGGKREEKRAGGGDNRDTHRGHTLLAGGDRHVDGMAAADAQRAVRHPAPGGEHRLLPQGPEPGGGGGVLGADGPGGF